MAVASRETSSVVYTLRIMSRLWNRDLYQSRENPVQTVLLLPLLKEKMISRTMGA